MLPAFFAFPPLLRNSVSRGRGDGRASFNHFSFDAYS